MQGILGNRSFVEDSDSEEVSAAVAELTDRSSTPY
jgi:hypothetical protein